MPDPELRARRQYIGNKTRALADLVDAIGFWDEERDEDGMGDRPKSGPVGSRLERPHHPDGWDQGGRKEDSRFDPEKAAIDARDHAARESSGS